MDRERLAAAAEQFRASGLLGKPGSLSRLFDYLLSRTLADEAPKEIEIAIQVFSKSPGFDVSQDAVVRVYVHKLRRRLNEFYAKAGSTAVGKLTIPKGEYRIVFETVDRPIASDDMAPDMPSGTPVLHRWPWSRLAVALLAGVSIPIAIAAAPALAEEKPKGHGDTPAAKYEPSLTTLGQAKVEMPGRKADDPLITLEEFEKA